MDGNKVRIDEFKAELANIQIKSTARATNDRRFLVGSIALMVVGVVAILGGYWGAAGTSDSAEAVSYLISGGVLGLALTIIGAALFLRYSLGGFLKFWMIRMIYEQQAQTDRTAVGLDTVEQAIRAASAD